MKPKLSSLIIIAGLLCVPSLTRGAGARADFDEAPTPVKAVAPDYPANMKREGTSGIVSVIVSIDENGDVSAREVAKSTRQEFEAAALAAVEKWKFKPAKKDGVAVKSRVTIPIRFSADT